MRSPVLLREIRIFLKCKEIRSPVARGIGYRVAGDLTMVPVAVLGFPVVLTRVVLLLLERSLAWLEARIVSPLPWFQAKRRETIQEAHEIMPREVIRERMGWSK